MATQQSTIDGDTVGTTTGGSYVGGADGPAVLELIAATDDDTTYNLYGAGASGTNLITKSGLENLLAGALIESIEVNYRARMESGASGAPTVNGVLRVGGTNYDIDTPNLLGTSYVTYQSGTIAVSPDTSNPWLVSELADIEWGYKITGSGTRLCRVTAVELVINFDYGATLIVVVA